MAEPRTRHRPSERVSVYGVEAKCCVPDKDYLFEGEELCRAATKAANDLLAVVAEYRDTARQLSDFRAALSVREAKSDG